MVSSSSLRNVDTLTNLTSLEKASLPSKGITEITTLCCNCATSKIDSESKKPSPQISVSQTQIVQPPVVTDAISPEHDEDIEDLSEPAKVKRVIRDLTFIFEQEEANSLNIPTKDWSTSGYKTFTTSYGENMKETFCLRPDFLMKKYVTPYLGKEETLPQGMKERFDNIFYETMYCINQSHPVLFSRLIRVEELPNNSIAKSTMLAARVICALEAELPPEKRPMQKIQQEETSDCCWFLFSSDSPTPAAY